jgi:hypothetical protein
MGLLSYRRCCLAMLVWTTMLPAGLVSRPLLTPPLSPQEMNFTLEGKITKQDAGKLTVSTEQNIVFHVSYDEKTQIQHEDGGQASGQDLRVGTRIKVEGELTESGEIKAQKIVVEKAQKSADGATAPPIVPARSRVSCPGLLPAPADR